MRKVEKSNITDAVTLHSNVAPETWHPPLSNNKKQEHRLVRDKSSIANTTMGTTKKIKVRKNELKIHDTEQPPAKETQEEQIESSPASLTQNNKNLEEIDNELKILSQLRSNRPRSPSSMSVISMSAFTHLNTDKDNTETSNPEPSTQQANGIVSSTIQDTIPVSTVDDEEKSLDASTDITVTKTKSSTKKNGFVISFVHGDEKVQVFISNLQIPKDVSVSFHPLSPSY